MSVAAPARETVKDGGGGQARRAVIRWAVRMFRREWRQQILTVAMLTVAVAAMIVGVAVASATPGDPEAAIFGTAKAMVTFSGSDPHLASDVATVSSQYAPVQVIDSQTLHTGTTAPATLLAEDPHGLYSKPMLGLVSGSYPAGPGQVAMTSDLASLYGLSTGGTWHYGGTARRLTGIVENPANLLDEFALLAPSQLAHPDQVSLLLDTNGNLTGLPPSAQVAYDLGNGSSSGGPSPALIALAVSALGLVFIGLMAVAGFAVMAQRRLRSLGMISSLGATEGNVRLVMIAGGAVTGVTAAVIGAVLGFAAWFAYAPHLQTAVGHVIDPLALPWPAIIAGTVLAVATAMLAAWQPARAASRVSVTAALSGRAPTPKASRRPITVGGAALIAGLVLLALSGGWSGTGTKDSAFLAAGLIGVIGGAFLLAPSSLRMLAAAGKRTPVATRIALRDLVRYRSRSGAALGATSLAVFVAMLICLIASYRFSGAVNALDWTGPNLSANELSIQLGSPPGGTAEPLAAQQMIKALAAKLHATTVLALDFPEVASGNALQPYSPLKLWQQGANHNNFSGNVYVATPALLAQYGIKQSQIAAGTDILTMRRGLATQPRIQLAPGCRLLRPSPRLPGCPGDSMIIDNPKMQTISSLPSGTSEPNTVITMQAVSQFGARLTPEGWLIQAPAALTATQISQARTAVAAAGGQIETKSGELSLAQIGDGATVAGLLIALAVLAMSVGLIRSETAGDLRTLTAAGASARTRRNITSATAAALGLLGAILGTALACLSTLAWAHSSLGTIFTNVPVVDYPLVLVGLPVIAAIGGWLLAGREPAVIARQPIE